MYIKNLCIDILFLLHEKTNKIRDDVIFIIELKIC